MKVNPTTLKEYAQIQKCIESQQVNKASREETVANFSLFGTDMIQLRSIIATLQDFSTSILKYFGPDNSLL